MQGHEPGRNDVHFAQHLGVDLLDFRQCGDQFLGAADRPLDHHRVQGGNVTAEVVRPDQAHFDRTTRQPARHVVVLQVQRTAVEDVDHEAAVAQFCHVRCKGFKLP